MATWDKASTYFSGQGVCLLGTRDSSGKAKRLLPIGNVSSLKTTIATTVVEHKESQSGQRGLDLRLTTEIKATMSAVMEDYNSSNLAISMRGDYSNTAAGTASSEAIKGYLGAVVPLAKIKVAVTSVKRAAQALTAYTNDTTPYDYKVNADAGSIRLNDGSVVAVDKLTTGGTAPSAVTVGYPTDITVATPAQFSVGDYVVFTGFTGADAALLNGIAFPTVAGAGVAGHVYLNVDTTGKTITVGTPLSYFDGTALTANYTYAGQFLVNSLTIAATDYYLRFEGLNTADSNKPVVVEVFRFSSDPLKELDLIGDTVQQFTLEGSVLSDPLQSSGSKYWNVKQLT